MRAGARLQTLICAGLLLNACSSVPAPTEVPAAAEDRQSALVLENIVLTEANRQGNGPLWELKARKAEYNRDRSVATVEEIEGVFYHNGRPVLTVQAPKGEVRIVAREIFLSGKVEALSPVRQTRFTASSVRWLPERNRLSAEGPVRLTQPGEEMVVQGRALSGDLAAQVFTLTGEVRATSPVHKLQLDAPRVRWQLQENLLIGDQGVTAHSDAYSVTLKAPQATWNVPEQLVLARADTTPVIVNTGDPQVDFQAQRMLWSLSRQVLEGEGKIVARAARPESSFEADRMTYTMTSRRLNASGQVRYWQARQNLRVEGPTAVAELGGTTVRMSGGRVVSRLGPGAGAR